MSPSRQQVGIRDFSFHKIRRFSTPKISACDCTVALSSVRAKTSAILLLVRISDKNVWGTLLLARFMLILYLLIYHSINSYIDSNYLCLQRWRQRMALWTYHSPYIKHFCPSHLSFLIANLLEKTVGPFIGLCLVVPPFGPLFKPFRDLGPWVFTVKIWAV